MATNWLIELQNWVREQPTAVVRLNQDEFGN